MPGQDDYERDKIRELKKEAEYEKSIMCKNHGLSCETCPTNKENIKLNEHGDICKYYRRKDGD